MRTVDEVFRSEQPALATIAKKAGQDTARALLVLITGEMLDFFNVRETMNDTQVAVTVDLILEEYPWMKPDDIRLCFRNAMKGRYGELYNRIDGSVILGWLRRYCSERCDRADELSYNEHRRILSGEARPTEGMFYPEYRRQLESLAAAGNKEAERLIGLSDGVQQLIDKHKRTEP